MPESSEHINLVRTIVKHIELQYKTDSAIIQIDAPNQKYSKPPVFSQGYSPDVYVIDSDRLVIGEAKTLEDSLRRHSRLQYKCYLSECESFKGESYLIVSVPWQVQISVYNHLHSIRRMIKNAKTKIVVLNQIGVAK